MINQSYYSFLEWSYDHIADSTFDKHDEQDVEYHQGYPIIHDNNYQYFVIAATYIRNGTTFYQWSNCWCANYWIKKHGVEPTELEDNESSDDGDNGSSDDGDNGSQLNNKLSSNEKEYKSDDEEWLPFNKRKKCKEKGKLCKKGKKSGKNKETCKESCNNNNNKFDDDDNDFDDNNGNDYAMEIC